MRQRLRRSGLAALALLLLPLSAAAQVGTDQPAVGGEQGRGSLGEQLSFRAGPFRIAPYVRVGQIAIDTNVYLTPDDRVTDLTANGGPGLRVGLPLGRVDLYVDGNLNYYWFARTTDLRRLGGQAGGGFEWLAGAFRMRGSSYLTRYFDRPSIEVDARVERDQLRTVLDLEFNVGPRLRVRPGFDAIQIDPAPGQESLGTDLTRTLSEDRYKAEAWLSYALTPKTDLVVLVDQQWNRYPLAPLRDIDSNRLAGGFALSSPTRLSGRFVGGVRFFRPSVFVAGADFTRPYAEADLNWRLGPKTTLGAEYRFDTSYSAYTSASLELPTVDRQDLRVWLNRRLGARADLDVELGLNKLENNVPVVVRPEEELETLRRDDTAYWGKLDLGIRIVSRLRLGAVLRYGERQSNFADFGVDGLVVGASLRFNP